MSVDVRDMSDAEIGRAAAEAADACARAMACAQAADREAAHYGRLLLDRKVKNGSQGPFVYMIECTKTGAFKIGRTTDPLRRMAGLQTGAPYHLRLVATLAGTPRDEARLHRRLSKWRIQGEWFEADGRDLALSVFRARGGWVA